MLALETRNLSFSFTRKQKVVNNVSLQVPDQSIYGFLGPNGAGKTTTIRLLTAMLLSNEDNIWLLGKSLLKTKPAIFEAVGALIETPSLYLHLTARENLKIIATLRNIGDDRINEVLSIVKLSVAANKKVKEFSLGMKQRLGIAMALLPNPQLLILDEPANGLDPHGIIEIRELLISLNKDYGKTIFISSHLLGEVEKTCTHIGIINQGSLKYQGTLEDMRSTANSAGQVIFHIPAANDWFESIKNQFPAAELVNQNEILFSFMDHNGVSNINHELVTSGVPVSGIHVRGGLEDWFMKTIQSTEPV
jgi:ABC-2 type transport system ATP-binding protein